MSFALKRGMTDRRCYAQKSTT